MLCKFWSLGQTWSTGGWGWGWGGGWSLATPIIYILSMSTFQQEWQNQVVVTEITHGLQSLKYLCGPLQKTYVDPSVGNQEVIKMCSICWFFGINIHTMADFKLPMWHHWTGNWEEMHSSSIITLDTTDVNNLNNI